MLLRNEGHFYVMLKNILSVLLVKKNSQVKAIKLKVVFLQTQKTVHRIDLFIRVSYTVNAIFANSYIVI